MHLSLQQCREGGYSIQAGAQAWAVSHLSPGWFTAQGHAGRGSLGTMDVTGKVAPVVALLCTVLDSALSCHSCVSGMPGWHSWELVGYRLHLIHLSCPVMPTDTHHFLFPAALALLPSMHSCQPSLHPGGAQAGGGSSKAPEMPISPNRRQRRATAGTNHC